MGLGDESKAVSTLGVRITDDDDGKECDAEESCLLPILGDAGQQPQSRQVWAAVRSEGACETTAAAECQEHAGAQALGATPERKSEVLGRLRSTR